MQPTQVRVESGKACLSKVVIDMRAGRQRTSIQPIECEIEDQTASYYTERSIIYDKRT
jgi:hypothetical protein